MSHQWNDGWFPECFVCGVGNLNAVVCLNPLCHEKHQGEIIESERAKYLEQDGHYWALCHWCDEKIRSDAASWGTFAICVDCWNDFAKKQMLPPSSPRDLRNQ